MPVQVNAKPPRASKPPPRRAIGFDPMTAVNATTIDRAGRKRRVPMQVICLGLPRTGTSSLRQALLDVGVGNSDGNSDGEGDVYHYSAVAIENPADARLWISVLDWKLHGVGEPWTRKEWDSLLGHCGAVTDLPCVLFAEELLTAYPEARVVLTVRDSVDVWYESVRCTLWSWVQQFYSRDACAARRLWRWCVSGRDRDFIRMSEMQYTTPHGMFHRFPENGKSFYQSHNSWVCRQIPRERLLVFNVKEGWEPLCRFLGKDIPNWDFPRVNDKAEFLEYQKRFVNHLNLALLKWILGYGIALAILVSFTWRKSLDFSIKG